MTINLILTLLQGFLKPLKVVFILKLAKVKIIQPHHTFSVGGRRAG